MHCAIELYHTEEDHAMAFILADDRFVLPQLENDLTQLDDHTINIALDYLESLQRNKPESDTSISLYLMEEQKHGHRSQTAVHLVRDTRIHDKESILMTKVIQLFPNGAPPIAKERAKPKGQRKDKLIQVSKSFGRKPNGKRDTKVFYGKTLKEACAKRDAYIEERDAGMELADVDITVSQWIERWYALYKSNLKTQNRTTYESATNRLNNTLIKSKRIGDFRMRDIREAHLQKALSDVEGMSDSLISKYKIIIQQVFAKAKKNKIIRDNPAEDLEAPEGTSGTHSALQRWEADCIMQNYAAHRSGLWAMVMMLAGLRPGELYALKWACVDLEKRLLTVMEASEREGNRLYDKNRTKSKAGMRVLPICDPLLNAFLSVPESERTGYVALSAKGQRITVSAARRGWLSFRNTMTNILRGESLGSRQGRRRPKSESEKAAYLLELETKRAEEAKRPRLFFLPHDLRHTFATALYDAGVDVKSAQYYLGHADIQITMNLYTHLSEEREKASRATLVGFLDMWLTKKPTSEIVAENQNAMNG